MRRAVRGTDRAAGRPPPLPLPQCWGRGGARCRRSPSSRMRERAAEPPDHLESSSTPERGTVRTVLVSTTPFAMVLRATLLAALVAGGVLGVFHLIVSEPVVDRAIAWEEARHADEDHGDEVFTRRQQKVGLSAASVTYALALGLIFGGVYAAFGHRLPGSSPGRRALALGAAAWWVLFVAPFLKNPGNPPGVGSPDSVYER